MKGMSEDIFEAFTMQIEVEGYNKLTPQNLRNMMSFYCRKNRRELEVNKIFNKLYELCDMPACVKVNICKLF